MKITVCVSSIKLVPSGYDLGHWGHILYNLFWAHTQKNELQ